MDQAHGLGAPVCHRFGRLFRSHCGIPWPVCVGRAAGVSSRRLGGRIRVWVGERLVAQGLLVEGLVDERRGGGVVGDAGSDPDERGLEADDIGSERGEDGPRAAVAQCSGRGEERAGRERERGFEAREELVGGRADAPVLDLREIAARAAGSLRDILKRKPKPAPFVMDERAEIGGVWFVRLLPRTWGARRRKAWDDGGVGHDGGARVRC